MNPVFIWACIVALILIITLIARPRKSARQQVTISSLEDLDKMIKEAIEEDDNHSVGDHLNHLDHVTARLSHNIAHNDLVLGLILDHLGLDHQVQPEQDMLVKKSKERSA